MEPYSKRYAHKKRRRPPITTEYVILVDAQDNQIGTEEKVKCHLPNGKLHRAFTALLFEPDGKLIITRRAPQKMLWPGCWDGTFASHPRVSETYITSAQRRMPEEVGIKKTLDYMHKFEYHVPYKDIGSENEICGTLVGVIQDVTTLECIPEEIDKVVSISSDDLVKELQKDPMIYCPWMLIALLLLKASDLTALEKHQNILSPWLKKPHIYQAITKAVDAHIPQQKWRLII